MPSILPDFSDMSASCPLSIAHNTTTQVVLPVETEQEIVWCPVKCSLTSMYCKNNVTKKAKTKTWCLQMPKGFCFVFY